MVKELFELKKRCYYCDYILNKTIGNFPKKCPNCNTITKWLTKEKFLESTQIYCQKLMDQVQEDFKNYKEHNSRLHGVLKK